MTEELLGLTQAQEFVFWEAGGRMVQGWSLVMQGGAATGLAAMRRGIAAVEAMGARIERPMFLAMLAEGYAVAADPAAGLEVLAAALAMAEETGEHLWAAELHRLRGVLLCQVGSPPATGQAHPVTVPGIPQPEACFHRALAIARDQQAKTWELRAAVSLSRLWQQQGRRQAAYDLLAPLYHWFTEGFDTADLQEARVLLESLAPR